MSRIAPDEKVTPEEQRDITLTSSELAALAAPYVHRYGADAWRECMALSMVALEAGNHAEGYTLAQIGCGLAPEGVRTALLQQWVRNAPAVRALRDSVTPPARDAIGGPTLLEVV